MVFKNEKQLKDFLIKKCVKAVDNTERKVHEEFAGNLNQFYTEFHPEEYIRTGALFNSLESTGARATDNGATAEVRFDIPSYQTGVMQLQSTPITGRTGYATWSGEDVLDAAMHGSHGGYEEGTAIWGESMSHLGGKEGIKNILKQELKKQGL